MAHIQKGPRETATEPAMIRREIRKKPKRKRPKKPVRPTEAARSFGGLY